MAARLLQHEREAVAAVCRSLSSDGLALGGDRLDAAVLGCAAAALVAQGLGTDHGDYDLERARELAARV